MAICQQFIKFANVLSCHCFPLYDNIMFWPGYLSYQTGNDTGQYQSVCGNVTCLTKTFTLLAQASIITNEIHDFHLSVND